MSILVYSGLRELIKRQFHDRDMATIDATANSIYSMIGEVMSDYRAKAIQIVGTLPVTGVAGTIYVMSKSEPNEKNRFIAYVFENGKYVQVGSSFFPEDFEHDAALSTTSHVTVENRAIHAELQNKYNVANIIDNVVYNDEHGIHANDTPTSAAIQRDLAKYMGYEDGNRITDAMLWQLFRPEKARLVYPYIKLNMNLHSSNTSSDYIRLAGQDLFSTLKYKSGLENSVYVRNNPIITLIDSTSDKDIRVRLGGDSSSSYTTWYAGFFDATKNPDEYTMSSYAHLSLEFKFLDPITIGALEDLIINIKTRDGRTTGLGGGSAYQRYILVTTKISDTGVDTEYTTIQDAVSYGKIYTDGIPFYGFNN